MSQQQNSDKEGFDAEEFVENLLTKGAETPCDETVSVFNEDGLPDFYDETLYQRGQKLFFNNCFSILLGNLMGLLCVLSIPTILRLLTFTKMSGSNLLAYRRYLSTLLHMTIWYEADFRPESRLWKSIDEVKNRHNSASKRGCAAGIHRINQKDMALTQFGFMGFALIRSEKIGLYNIQEEDYKGLVHVWRVVGRMMGIEDRFNICRENIEETRQIGNILIDKVFRPNVERQDKDFVEMSRYLIEGMWTVAPFLQFDSFMIIFHDILQPLNNDNNNRDLKQEELYKKLTFIQRALLRFLLGTIWSLQFIVTKWIVNFLELRAMWLRKHFPFLAYWKYGYQNSQLTMPQ